MTSVLERAWAVLLPAMVITCATAAQEGEEFEAAIAAVIEAAEPDWQKAAEPLCRAGDRVTGTVERAMRAASDAGTRRRLESVLHHVRWDSSPAREAEVRRAILSLPCRWGASREERWRIVSTPLLAQLEDRLVAFGAAAVPVLIETIRRQSWGYACETSEAALGRIRDVRAIEAALQALEERDLRLYRWSTPEASPARRWAALGEVARPALRKFLRARRFEVWQLAATTLVRMPPDEPTAVDLAATLRDEPQYGCVYVGGGERSEEFRYTDPISAYLADPRCAGGLAAIRDHFPRLRREQPKCARQLVIALGLAGAEAAVPFLLEVLRVESAGDDPAGRLQGAATVSLARIGTPECRAVIRSRWEAPGGDEDFATIHATRLLCGPADAGAFVNRFCAKQDWQDPRLLEAYHEEVRALGEPRASLADLAIVRLVNAASPPLVAAALRIVRDFDVDLYRRETVRRLADPSAEMRREALQAADPADHRRHVLRLATDPCPAVRSRAFQSLDARDFPPDLEAAVLEWLTHRFPDVRARAAELAGRRRLTSAVGPLVRSLRNTGPGEDDLAARTRSAAALVLITCRPWPGWEDDTCGGQQRVPATPEWVREMEAWHASSRAQTRRTWVEASARTGDPKARELAAQELQGFKDARAGDLLVELLGDRERGVRCRAIESFVALTGHEFGLSEEEDKGTRTRLEDLRAWWRAHWSRPRWSWLMAALDDPERQGPLYRVVESLRVVDPERGRRRLDEMLLEISRRADFWRTPRFASLLDGTMSLGSLGCFGVLVQGLRCAQPGDGEPQVSSDGVRLAGLLLGRFEVDFGFGSDADPETYRAALRRFETWLEANERDLAWDPRTHRYVISGRRDGR